MACAIKSQLQCHFRKAFSDLSTSSVNSLTLPIVIVLISVCFVLNMVNVRRADTLLVLFLTQPLMCGTETGTWAPTGMIGSDVSMFVEAAEGHVLKLKGPALPTGKLRFEFQLYGILGTGSLRACFW